MGIGYNIDVETGQVDLKEKGPSMERSTSLLRSRADRNKNEES